MHNARDKIAAGREVMVPKAIVDRLAAGGNPTRVLREWRAMTQVELAAAVDIAQGYLSDLEGGKRKGPVALHQRIAQALRVRIDLLLPASERKPDMARVTKRARRLTGRRPRR